MSDRIGAPESSTVRLFQYGSNMARGRFIQRIEAEYEAHTPRGTPVLVTLLGPARLDNWRLRANLWSATRGCRVVNIVEENGAEVWGALYKIAAALVTRCDGKRSVVDRLEGHRTTRDPENYAKICVTVDVGGEMRAAWTYIGLRQAIARCEREHPTTACDSDYMTTVIAGAESIGVPDRYLMTLREALEHG
jgi:hypothetical protein